MTFTATQDIGLAKFNSAGVHQWSKFFGGTGLDVAQGLAVDSVGNVVLAGAFRNSVNFGGGSFSSAGGSADVFVAKYAAGDGAHLWSRRFGGAGADDGRGAAVSSGGVFVTGTFEGIAEFSDEALTSVGMFDGFCIGLSP